MIFALIIIWLGVFLLFRTRTCFADNDQGWAIFVWGVAAIWLVEILLRLVVPRWRQPLSGHVRLDGHRRGVGFGLWTNDWEIFGPIVLIAVGVAIVARDG